MVCTFFFIVLPALVCRALYWVFGFFTGAKANKPAAAEQENKDAGKQAADAGGCPYHALLRFFGFQVPEKKQEAAIQENPAP